MKKKTNKSLFFFHFTFKEEIKKFLCVRVVYPSRAGSARQKYTT